MDIWQVMLVALGGPTILIGAISFLAKSLISQWLTKEIKSHEAILNRDSTRFELELKSKYDAATEGIRSELQRQASDHQIRYVRLHEKRADVIADVYARFVDAYRKLESLVAPLQYVGEPSRMDKLEAAERSTLDFFSFLDRHRIFLPSDLCNDLEGIATSMRRIQMTLGQHLQAHPDSLPLEILRNMQQDQIKMWEQVRTTEFPESRAKLERQFRALLGDSQIPTPSPGATPPASS